MLTYHCTHCPAGYRVATTDPRLDLLTLKMSCPACSEGAIMVGQHAGRASDLLLSAEALYRASAGLGLETEQDCSLELVQMVLANAVVIEADLEAGPQAHHSYLHSLTIAKDGARIRLYLGTSPGGPLLYRRQEIAP